jgi:hypothetical protein
MNDMRMHLIYFGVAIALAACTQNVPFGMGAPILDSHFGEAVARARAMQTINLEGTAVNDEGSSGKAAQTAMDHYDRGRPVAAPAPQAVQMVPATAATPPR